MTTPGALSPSTNYAERATQYARDVASGHIPACKWVRLACQRHLNDLAASESAPYPWVYDAAKANRVCTFAEMLPHIKGELQGQPVRLEPWQCFVICCIFGWVSRSTGYRRFREAFLLLPRGSGKSPLAAWIGIWMAFFDREKGAEVYCGAAGEAQALEVFGTAKAICEMVPALTQRFGIQVNASALTHPGQRSRFKPVIGRPKDGASVYLAIVDEFHEHLTGEQYETFLTGSSKRKGSLILIISSAGSTTEGACHNRQRDVEKVLEGSIEDDSLFGLIYTADPELDWTSLAALEQANPNLYISMDSANLIRQQAEAARNPSRQNTFRNKHLNQWTNAATSWMNMVAWQACADINLSAADHTQDPCWLGSDLASKLDLSAIVRLHRRDIDGKPHYYCFAHAYLPEDRVNDPANHHYQRWKAQGYITATPGASMDYSVLEADTIADIERYQVRELAYDARYADQYAQRVSERTGVGRVVIPPSSAQLSPAMKELEAAVYDGRLHHDGNPVLTWAMSNVIAKEWGGSGNYSMPDKQRPENKIDPAVALMIAMTRARVATPTKHTWTAEVW